MVPSSSFPTASASLSPDVGGVGPPSDTSTAAFDGLSVALTVFLAFNAERSSSEANAPSFEASEFLSLAFTESVTELSQGAFNSDKVESLSICGLGAGWATLSCLAVLSWACGSSAAFADLLLVVFCSCGPFLVHLSSPHEC